MKKIHICKILICTIFCGIFASCNDPIFYLIESEVKPKVAKIPGSPSKIVSDGNGTLYVANGSIWRWSADRWEKTDSPAGSIRDMAFAGGALYALAVANDESSLYKKPAGGTWKRISAPDGYGFIQGIYGAGDALFAYARGTGGDYRVFVESDGVLYDAAFTAELYGVVFMGGGNYYFATNNGIYTVAAPINGGTVTSALVTDTDGKGAWLGIAASGDIVAATSKSGWVFLCSATIPPVIERKETSYAFSNALCFWQKDGGGQYLLIGIRGSAYTNGYRELDLRQEDGVWKLGACTSPVASVESSAKYASTLGIHALTSIIQAPGSIAANGYPLVFASTQQHGLWSYRGVWNAEE